MKTDSVEVSSERQQHPVSAYPNWLHFRRWFARNVLGGLLAKVLWKFTVTGIENVPRSGPTILVFNHQTYLDAPVIGLATKFRDITALGKEELTNSLITGFMLRYWGTIPIRRGEVDRSALKRAIAVLEHTNDILLISPEGHRQKQGMHDPKVGVVLLAAHAKAVIVPMGISGTEQYAHYLKRLKRIPITANIGKPFRIKEGITRKQYEQAAHEIMYQIAPLAAPSLRGDYADLSKATMDTLEYANIQQP